MLSSYQHPSGASFRQGIIHTTGSVAIRGGAVHTRGGTSFSSHGGLTSPSACLLVGPPGCGKTLVWRTLVAALNGAPALADPSVVVRLYPEVWTSSVGGGIDSRG